MADHWYAGILAVVDVKVQDSRTFWDSSLYRFWTNLILDGVDIPGTISVREYDHKSVEGVNSNGFVVYPIFQCAGCRKTKSSMEISDLSKMGVPPYILRRCPVISMLKTSYSSELAELILTLMTSELGAGQIANFITKKRAAFWVSQARVYLEAHVANTEDISSLSAFGFTRSISSSPFPTLTSHCGGFGGSRGPSQRQIQRFF